MSVEPSSISHLQQVQLGSAKFSLDVVQNSNVCFHEGNFELGCRNKRCILWSCTFGFEWKTYSVSHVGSSVDNKL